MAFIRPEKGFSSTVGTISRSKGHFEGWVFVVLAHAFLALLESRRSLSVGPRRLFSINSKRTLIQADGVEIYGLTVRRPRKSAIADAKIQTECADQSIFPFHFFCGENNNPHSEQPLRQWKK